MERFLYRVSFRLEPGTFTALVGPSGSGKTTVLRLVARFWDATSGSVRLGGVDVRQLGSEQVIERVAVVFQDVYLFEGSILDNIAFVMFFLEKIFFSLSSLIVIFSLSASTSVPPTDRPPAPPGFRPERCRVRSIRKC